MSIVNVYIIHTMPYDEVRFVLPEEKPILNLCMRS
jgi:hypothetical protein